MTASFALRTVLTLALALAAAALCVWLRTPLPWMIGPLLGTAAASVLGAPTQSWTPLRNAGQWAIGKIVDQWPRTATGYAPDGYTWAFGALFILQLAGLAWLVLSRARPMTRPHLVAAD